MQTDSHAGVQQPSQSLQWQLCQMKTVVSEAPYPSARGGGREGAGKAGREGAGKADRFPLCGLKTVTYL